MTSCFYLEPETSNIHPGQGEGHEQNEEEEDEEGEGGGKGKGAGGRFWKLPLTAFAFAISSVPLLIAEEVKEKVEEKSCGLVEKKGHETTERKLVVVAHLNAEEKKKVSDEKKMVMGKSQEDRIRFYLEQTWLINVDYTMRNHMIRQQENYHISLICMITKALNRYPKIDLIR